MKHPTTLRTAARQLLSTQHRAVASIVRKACGNPSTEQLHDIRGGLRRFAQILRLLRRPLAGTGAEALRRRIRSVNRQLGQTRDIDVWMANMSLLSPRRSTTGNKEWRAFQSSEIGEWEEHRRLLKSALVSGPFVSVMAAMGRLIDIRIPKSPNKLLAQDFAAYSGKRLQKLVRRLVHSAPPDSRTEPALTHQFRRLCRRGRYWAEAATPVLGHRAAKLGICLRHLSTDLGQIHDLDVAAARLSDSRKQTPATVLDHVVARRNKLWSRFPASWHKFKQASGQFLLFRC